MWILAVVLSFSVQQYGLSEIYKATLVQMPTLAWLMLAFLCFLSMVVWFFGHLAYIHEDRAARREEQKGKKEKEVMLDSNTEV